MTENTKNYFVLSENQKSGLLSQVENEVIFSLLGPDCISLSTTLAQLLVTEAPEHTKWRIECIGVACFVKDYQKRTYYIRIYDFVDRILLWEQELYNLFEYKISEPFFHTFEALNCMSGLNFADRDEAQHYKNIILGILRQREQRRHNNESPNSEKTSTFYLTKPIGTPTNFKHIQHIGLKSNTDLNLVINDNKDVKHESQLVDKTSTDQEFEVQSHSVNINNTNEKPNAESAQSPMPMSEYVPAPKPRTRALVGSESSKYKSVSTQTETYESLEWVIANKHFRCLSSLPVPTPFLSKIKVYFSQHLFQ